MDCRACASIMNEVGLGLSRDRSLPQIRLHGTIAKGLQQNMMVEQCHDEGHGSGRRIVDVQYGGHH